MSLSPDTVLVVLRYIRDSVPIPAHLLSLPLRQRHHFLDLSISDLESYLCWPTTCNPHSIVQYLQEIDISDDTAFSKTVSFRYTADPEHFYAHVSLGPHLRLVFMRSSAPSDSWKYHDANSTPFPPNLYLTMEEALASLHPQSQCEDYPPSITTDDDDESSYWDSYGQNDELDPYPNRHSDKGKELTEDAYWAQYSTVQGIASTHSRPTPTNSRFTQGTADSEIPSPLPVNPKRSAGQPDNATNPQELSAPPVELAQRLSELSSRPGETAFVMPITGPPSPSSMLNGITLTTLPQQQPQEDSNALFQIEPPNSIPPPNPSSSSPSDQAAKAGIQAIFKLWSAQNTTESVSSQLERFSQLVKEATTSDPIPQM